MRKTHCATVGREKAPTNACAFWLAEIALPLVELSALIRVFLGPLEA